MTYAQLCKELTDHRRISGGFRIPLATLDEYSNYIQNDTHRKIFRDWYIARLSMPLMQIEHDYSPFAIEYILRKCKRKIVEELNNE